VIQLGLYDMIIMEVMYDRYVVKFSEYRVSMLMLLLSLSCLTELIFYFVVDVTTDHIITVVLAMSMLLLLIFTQVNSRDYFIDFIQSTYNLQA